jgi:tetratricopeptide (TPR) repeat protein
VGLTAQWVDAGFEGAEVLARLLDRFPARNRGALPLLDYLHLRMAEGVQAMGREEFDGALAHFQLIDSLSGEAGDPELAAVANYWAGRCLRKAGRYDDASSYTAKAEALARECGYEPMAAVMQVHQSWLAFQKGRLQEAQAILRHAAEVLDATDDHVSLGNVHSAYGRIARRQARYDQARDCFGRAISEYRRAGGAPLRLARALMNLAFVNRLVALEIQKTLDRRVASRRSGSDAPEAAERARDERLRIEMARATVREQLAESMALYQRHASHRGIAGVHINSGLLYLDSGDLECASAEAAEAFRHGEQHRDYIVMARARTLECMVEYARLEEQIGDPERHFERAEALAHEAVEFASHTQNRRLLARATVWQGLVWAVDRFGNPEKARRCAEQAAALLRPESLEKEYVWEDLETLKAAVRDTGPVDPKLRAWSAGLVGDNSFQQIAREFARLIIPKVWEREGRKISRVAARLAISPKKVRRVLLEAGLIGRPPRTGRPAGQP